MTKVDTNHGIEIRIAIFGTGILGRLRDSNLDSNFHFHDSESGSGLKFQSFSIEQKIALSGSIYLINVKLQKSKAYLGNCNLL